MRLEAKLVLTMVLIWSAALPINAGSISAGAQDQFGHATEADVQQPADRLADAPGEMLRRPPHPIGQHGDGHRPRQEDGDRRAELQ